MAKILVTIVGLALIVFVNVYFFGKRVRKTPGPRP
jgi:hypothetical protein